MNNSLRKFHSSQLDAWKLALDNHQALQCTEEKVFELGGLEVKAICNPARIVSTGAKVDPESLAKRKCFLCESSRPAEQTELNLDGMDRFSILVNPFPICPLHFTIASKEHIPQEKSPEEMIIFAETFPRFAAFYNGARAGASAPDHLHFQAVESSLLPLLKVAEEMHTSEGIEDSVEWKPEYPFAFRSYLGNEAVKGVDSLPGYDAATGLFDKALVNTFVWTDISGKLRAITVPRKAHRPPCYFAEGEKKMLISPGALDMAGLLVVPRREDFLRLSVKDIREIYEAVGITEEEYVRIYENF